MFLPLDIPALMNAAVTENGGLPGTTGCRRGRPPHPAGPQYRNFFSTKRKNWTVKIKSRSLWVPMKEVLPGFLRGGTAAAFALFAATGALIAETPGVARPGQGRPRIFGGQNAAAGEFPWMVALLDKNDPDNYDAHFCGGVLIHPRWVVTAGHCVMGQSPETLDVLAGTHVLDGTGTRIAVQEIITFPRYQEVLSEDNDLALVLLATPAPAGTPVLPLIEDPAWANPGVQATVIGWGNTVQLGQGFPSILQKTMVPVVSLAVADAPAAHNGTLTLNMLPAGFAEGGNDTCEGDSGGPLLVRRPDNAWVLAGVTSFGDPDSACASPNNYGIYTRVSRYRHWINRLVSPEMGSWEAVHGHTGESGDADGDGQFAWQEYAFNTNPNSGQSGLVIGPAYDAGGNPVPRGFIYKRRTVAPEISYLQEFRAGSLVSWDAFVGNTIGSAPVPGEPGLQLVTVQAAPQAADNGFFRVRVVRNSSFVPGTRDLQFPGGVLHRLHDQDERSGGPGTPFLKRYELHNLPAAGTVILNLRATAFDPVLRLVNRASGVLIDSSSSNNAGGQNEQITFTPVPGILYNAEVTLAAANETGDFLLGAYAPITGLPSVTTSESRNGSLAVTDAHDPGYEGFTYYKDDYRLTGTVPGVPVTVRYNSAAFDTFLQIIDAATNRALFVNDDFAGANNSRLTFVPVDGVPYLIRVTSFVKAATGSYTLVTEQGGTIPTMSVPGAAGGTLAPGDELDPIWLPNRQFYKDDYILTDFTPGQVVTLRMNSSFLDAFLELVDQNGMLLDSNDDGGDGTNAQLTFTVQSGVIYTLRATTALQLQTGSYNVTSQ